MGKILVWVVVGIVVLLVMRIAASRAADRKSRQEREARDAAAGRNAGSGRGAGWNAESGRDSGGNGAWRGQNGSAGGGGQGGNASSPGGQNAFEDKARGFGRQAGAWAQAFKNKRADQIPTRPKSVGGTDPTQGSSEPMVRCAHCNIYLPRSEALLKNGETWCRHAHAELGVRKD